MGRRDASRCDEWLNTSAYRCHFAWGSTAECNISAGSFVSRGNPGKLQDIGDQTHIIMKLGIDNCMDLEQNGQQRAVTE